MKPAQMPTFRIAGHLRGVLSRGFSQKRSRSGHRSALWRSVAPRPTKMGNIVSPWRYEGETYHMP